MGYKYEVSVWIKKDEDYQYQQIYHGEWLVKALWHLFVGKCKHKAGCVKLEYR